MMRSPEQQFNFAKRLPVQELARVLQGQSDVVDMSIAEMVLRQKMQMQKAQQGAAAVPMAQGPKVVERDLAQAGVAAMPAPNLENVDSYAGGGIVAFQGGGQSSLPFASSVGPALQSTRVPGAGPTFASAFPEFAAAEKAAADAAATSGGRVSFTAALKRILGPAYALYEMQDLYRQGMAHDTGMGFGDMGEQMTIGTPLQAPRERAVDKVLAARAAAQPPEKPAETKTDTVPPKPPGASAVEKEEAGLSSLIDKFYGPARTAESLQDITQKRLALYKQLGVEAEPYEKAIKKLEEQKAADVEARREAGWGRLLEAGLGIMGGTSPYALTNIGQGAQAAAKGAMEDIKDFRKLERERQKAITDYNLAANAYKKSGADADLAAAIQDRNRVDTLNMKRADAGLTVAVEQIKLKAQRESKLDERDLKLYLGALEQAGNMLKNNFDVSSMPLDEIQAKVSAQAARIYNQYKTGNFGAGVSTGIDASQWGTPRIK